MGAFITYKDKYIWIRALARDVNLQIFFKEFGYGFIKFNIIFFDKVLKLWLIDLLQIKRYLISSVKIVVQELSHKFLNETRLTILTK